MSTRWFVIPTWMLITAVVGCGAVQRTDPEASEKQYLLGADYFSKGMMRPAIEELLKAIQQHPKNADALYLLGIVALRQAADGEAMLEQQACLKGEEAQLIRSHEVDARFREAETRFRQALDAKPQFPEAWNSLAVVDLHFQRWDQAIAQTSKALSDAVYRQPWMAQANLAWALYQKRELPRAMMVLRTALFSNPQFCVGRYRLAKIYFDQANYDGATEELEKVTGDPKCPIQEAFHLLGLVATKRQDRSRAVDAFKRCEALAPKSCLAKECRIALK